LRSKEAETYTDAVFELFPTLIRDKFPKGDEKEDPPKKKRKQSKVIPLTSEDWEEYWQTVSDLEDIGLMLCRN